MLLLLWPYADWGGSNISLCLARAGIGRLILIDFDRVDITNLHRQQYKAHQIGMYKTEALAENLREIAPYLSLELHTETMTEENTPQLLQNAQIICEAFDRAENKAMLVNRVLETMPEKFLVAASGMAGISSANSVGFWQNRPNPKVQHQTYRKKVHL